MRYGVADKRLVSEHRGGLRYANPPCEVRAAKMAKHVNLHQANAEHYDFALDLYLLTMRPYLQELRVWNEQGQRESFAAQWKREEVRIISVDGRDVGFLQVAELPTEIRLQKFFVSPQYQRSGIGSEILGNLLRTWRSTGKKIVLRVLRNNPARRLYERLGFLVVAEEDVTFRMRHNVIPSGMEF